MGLGTLSANNSNLWGQFAPVTGAPFTLGYWYYNLNTSLLGGVTLNDPTNSGSDGFFIYASGGTYVFQAGPGAVTCSAGTATANKWTYILCRATSVSNRWISVLNPDGSIASGQSTTSITPAGVAWLLINGYRDNFIGPLNLGDGIYGEPFVAKADVQPDGLTTQAALIRQLAYKGPWSIPSLVPNIVFYDSFRRGYNPAQGEEVYPQGIKYFANTNCLPAPHPPLAPDYKRPTDNPLELMV
jgi:hypothetical protein